MMNSAHVASRRAPYPITAASAAAQAVIFLGTVGLCGWLFDVPAWRSIIPGAVEMKLNTALGLALAGYSQYISGRYVSARATLAARTLAAIVACIGVASMSEYVFGVQLGIDELFFKDTLHPYSTFAGRMSPLSAIAFIASGVALGLATYPAYRRKAAVAAAIVLSIGTISFLGYLWKARELITDNWLPPIAINTGVGFLLLGGAMLATNTARPELGAPGSGLKAVEVKVLTGFAVALALLIVGGGYTYRSSLEFADSVQWVVQTQDLRLSLSDLNVSITGAELAERDYILSADATHRADYEQYKASVEKALALLGKGLSDNGTQLPSLSKIRPIVVNRLQAMDSVILACDTFGRLAGRALMQLQRRSGSDTAEVVSMMDGMSRVEAQLLTQRQAASVRQRYLTLISLLSTLGFGVAILIYLFQGIRREISARDQLEQKLLLKARELAESNRELESFSYSISHDLRAPLRAINGFALMLLEDYAPKLDAEGRRHLSVIQNNSKRMGALIDDLLSFSRLGRQAVAKHTINMDGLVSEVVEEALRGHQHAPPTLQIQSLPPAYGDRALIRQVWVNLVSNALKYCGKNLQPLIIVSGSHNDGESVYEIQDNGVGFNMEYVDKLFGVFQRLHRAEEFEGTGVGLAIVHRIISRHGGRVWAESTVGHGAKFSFSLTGGAHG